MNIENYLKNLKFTKKFYILIIRQRIINKYLKFCAQFNKIKIFIWKFVKEKTLRQRKMIKIKFKERKKYGTY